MALKKIVLAGGTGNIGKLLIAYFTKLNYEIVILSRQARKSHNSNISYQLWDGEKIGDWIQVLNGADTLINMSGKSIQCRFTESNKKELLESRILPTKILGEAIGKLDNPPRLWINFSGISIFEGLDGFHDEESTYFSDTFLAELAKKWEDVFLSSFTLQTKKACLRLSPVLSKDFGMFKELLPLSKLGLGGQVGNGEQYISWIHEDDLIQMIRWIIDQESPSVLYHATAPKPEKNKIFMQNLRKAVHMPIGLPLPTPLAKLGAYFKGVESDMLLLTNAVESKRPLDEGFVFRYPTTELAFEKLTAGNK